MARVSIGILLLSSFAASATGEILVGNLSEPVRDATPISNPEYWGAQSFIMDARYAQLTSIDAYVGDAIGNPDIVAELRWHDANGQIDLSPTGLVTTFTVPDVTGAGGPRTFIPDSSVTLLPNGGYWFVLGSTTPDTYFWSYANTGDWEGLGMLDWFADSSDAGVTWTYAGDPGPFFPYMIQVDVELPSGDFDGNGLYECADVDALTADIAAATNTPVYDLTGDALVDLADLDAWLTEAGQANLSSQNAYLYGDADLDGVVDGSDFIVWNAHKFTQVAAWCSGDFNADGVVDGVDFIAWNAHKFTSADVGASPVPEPGAAGILAMVLWGAGTCRRHKTRYHRAAAAAGKLRRVSCFRLGGELLEDRRLLSTINWTNRGTTDNFGVYGANANTARDIVDRAIVDWQRVIDNFNYDGGGNTFSVTVTAADQGGGGRGVTNNILRNNATQKKPIAADIQMDDDGGGSGWYFDPVPWLSALSPDDGEFTTLLTPFTADNGTMGNDFYRTIVHELGHAMGIRDDANGYLRIGELLQDTGFADPNGGTLKAINIGGGPIEYTMTTQGGGHLWEGGPTSYTGPAHPNDLMNDGRTVNLGITRRQLITDTDARLLADVYGYAITLPSTINTLLVNPDYATDILTIQGQPGVVDELVVVQGTATPGEMHVSVGTFTEIIPWPQINSIAINAGGGQDIVRLEFNAGKPTTVSGGDGDDIIDFSFATRNLSNLAASTSVSGGAGFDRVFVYDNSNSAATQYDVSSARFDRSGWGGLSYAADIEALTLTTGTGNDTVNVTSTFENQPIVLNSAGGEEIVNLGDSTNGVQQILADVQIQNDPWFTTVNISDAGNSNSRNAILDQWAGNFGALAGLAPAYITWDNSDIREVRITTGSGADHLEVRRSSERLMISNTNGVDHVSLGNDSTGLNEITGAVDVGPNAPFVLSDLTINDAVGTVNRYFNWLPDANGYYLTGFSAAVRYENVLNLHLLAGNGSDQFVLNGVADDLINIDGGGGVDYLTIDDRTMPFTLTVADLYENRFERQTGGIFSTGPTTYFSNIESPTIYLAETSSNNTIHGTPSSILPGFQLTLFGGSAADTFTVKPRDDNGNPSLLGPMGILGGLGVDSIVIDDSASLTGATWVIDNYFGAGTQNFIVGGGAYFGSLNDIEHVLLKGSQGDDTFQVERYQSGTELQIMANDGNDTLEISPTLANLYSSITAFIAGADQDYYFDGGEGYDQLLVNNQNGSGYWTYTRTDEYLRVQEFFGHALALHDNGFEYLWTNGATQTDIFDVRSIRTDSVSGFDGGDGDNQFFVGDNQLTSGILGGLQFYPTLGTNSVTIDNSADIMGRVVHVDITDVGAAPGDDLFGPGGFLLYSNFSGPLTVKLGTGDDTVYVAPHPYTPIVIDDPNPAVQESTDFLGLALAQVTNPAFTANGANAGTYTFDDAASITYTGMENTMIDDTSPQVVSTVFLDSPVHRVRFEFNEDISAILRAEDLILTDLGTGLPLELGPMALSYDYTTNTAEFNFPGLPGGQLPTGDYRATLNDRVSDLFGNPLAPYAPFDFNVASATVDGDFNDDGVYDVWDIDALVGEIVAATNNPAYDLTGDGLVDLLDRDAWLAEAGSVNLPSGGAYLLGDANLDGVVDGQDFIAWNSHKFQSTARWQDGDFNADGFVDGQDFILWNSHKFQSSDIVSFRSRESA